jgi:hypothetical protein
LKAWDINENIRKAFAKHGSGSAPLIFKDEDGNHYEFKDVKADKKLVVVEIKRV